MGGLVPIHVIGLFLENLSANVCNGEKRLTAKGRELPIEVLVRSVFFFFFLFVGVCPAFFIYLPDKQFFKYVQNRTPGA